MNEYFSGKKLYGDNFSEHEIKQWYEEEEEAYSDLVDDSKKEYGYMYNSMNYFYGFKYLKSINKYDHVLGIGSAFGHEFLPHISKIENLTIIEPSENLRSDKLGHLTPNYVKPNINGKIDFPNSSFDLITCFGVLHHIPNVSYVLSDMKRVLKPGGFMLIREPIRTMGDWRGSRKGLTKNERGIPKKFFDDFIKKSDLQIIKKSFCQSNFAYRIIEKFIKIKRDSIGYQKFDSIISKLLNWNIHYHPSSSLQKIGPGSVFYVIQKK